MIGPYVGSTQHTTPSSGFDAPLGFDFVPADMDPLGAMFDVPNDFDWVCCVISVALEFGKVIESL